MGEEQQIISASSQAAPAKHNRTPSSIMVACISGANGGLLGLAITAYLTISFGAPHPILRIVIMSIFGATGGLLGVYFARLGRAGMAVPLALAVGALGLLACLLFVRNGQGGVNYLLAITVGVGFAALTIGAAFFVANLSPRRTTAVTLAALLAILGVAAVVFSLLGLGVQHIDLYFGIIPSHQEKERATP